MCALVYVGYWRHLIGRYLDVPRPAADFRYVVHNVLGGNSLLTIGNVN